MEAHSTTPPTTKRGGEQPISNFADDLGYPEEFATRIGGHNENSLTEAISWIASSRPRRQNYWPALCLAYISQCEEALTLAGQESEDDPFHAFPIEGSTGQVTVNTLNFQVEGNKVRLRPKFNSAASVIRVDMRREHPSAAPHATQSWPDYVRLIELIYAMTPSARTRFAEYVWQTGVVEAPERRWAEQAVRIVRPYEKVLADFDTYGATPGGALFQSLVFGFFTADSPSLTLESHKVNTGSSRADMPGDVAGFRGGEVELAVEVKDRVITGDTVETVLVDFLEDLVGTPNATAVVVAAEVDEASRQRLDQSNVVALSRDDLRTRVVTWDLPKQQDAVRGAIYFLGRIQKNRKLVDRLVDFLVMHEIATGIFDHPAFTDDAPTAQN